MEKKRKRKEESRISSMILQYALAEIPLKIDKPESKTLNNQTGKYHLKKCINNSGMQMDDKGWWVILL